jgi:uncharacterized membrane protein YbaN (DUF454 family)
MRKAFFVILGTLNVGLGALGVLLPVLPTTPFLLLAAFLFARSHDGCYRWLLSQKYLGPYIHAFRNKAGLTREQKWRIGISFTVLLGVSIYFAPLHTVRVLLLGLWLFWLVVLVRIRTEGGAP